MNDTKERLSSLLYIFYNIHILDKKYQNIFQWLGRLHALPIDRKLSRRKQISSPWWKHFSFSSARSLFQRFLAIACIVIFIPLTIAAVVVLGLIPVYLTNRSVRTTQMNVGRWNAMISSCLLYSSSRNTIQCVIPSGESIHSIRRWCWFG